MSTTRKRAAKMPEAFAPARDATYAISSAEHVLTTLGTQRDQTLGRAWEAMDAAARRKAVRWAETLTTTNCGWAEYEIGRMILALRGETDAPASTGE